MGLWRSEGSPRWFHLGSSTVFLFAHFLFLSANSSHHIETMTCCRHMPCLSSGQICQPKWPSWYGGPPIRHHNTYVTMYSTKYTVCIWLLLLILAICVCLVIPPMHTCILPGRALFVFSYTVTAPMVSEFPPPWSVAITRIFLVCVVSFVLVNMLGLS